MGRIFAVGNVNHTDEPFYKFLVFRLNKTVERCRILLLFIQSFSKHPLSYIGIIDVYKYSINSKGTTWTKRSHIIQRISYEIINLNSTLLNHSRSWGPIFVGKQIFAGSSERYSWVSYTMSPGKISQISFVFQNTERVTFLIFY